MGPTEQPPMKLRCNRRTILAVLGGFVVAIVLAFLIVRGCGDSTAPEYPRNPESIPIVRVRLQNTPVHEISLTSPAGKTGTLRRTKGAFLLGTDEIPSTSLILGVSQDAPSPTFKVGGVAYRGWLEAVASSDETFYLVNHIDVESYVASVIACELYPDFADEAYRAQAITSRTLALAEIANRKSKSYDVWASVRSQRYRGQGGETAKSWRATRATRGTVLAFATGNKPPALFRPYFSACNAGYVNSLAVLTGRATPLPIAPLRGGQKDIDQTRCRQWTWPPVRISKALVYRALAERYSAARKLGPVTKLEVLTSTGYGRPLMLRATGILPAHLGPAPTFDLVAEDLLICLYRTCPKAAKGLLSMNCKIRDDGDAIVFEKGGGFGHGIGMSQWGAQLRAADYGQTAEEILGFYFPKAVLIQAYE